MSHTSPAGPGAAGPGAGRDEALLRVVGEVAEELFVRALDTDAADVVPVANLDRLAGAGLYGLPAPAAVGGLGASPGTVLRAIELLAGGCMTTTFVWQQHLGALRGCLGHPDRAARLASGSMRAGVAFAHLRRGGPPALTATPDGPDAWILDGTAPWVTGWGRIDVVHTAAVDADDRGRVVWLLVDATASTSLRPRRLRLAAVDASSTVEVRFEAHRVDASQVTAFEPLDAWRTRDELGLRGNGSLALGLTGRVVSLLGDGAGALPEALVAARRQLDAAVDLPSMALARARATVLAVTAAQALVAAGGGGAVQRDHHAQRIMREAMFLTVQGQTPAIRAAQAALLGG